MHLDQYGNSYICVCVEAMDWYLMSSTKKKKNGKKFTFLSHLSYQSAMLNMSSCLKNNLRVCDMAFSHLMC